MFFQCNSGNSSENDKTPVILDTDANNEVDDQHAIAYLLNSQEDFNILGITVNATKNGGPVEKHYEEARRIVAFFNELDNIDIKKGANKTFAEIKDNLENESYDGAEAVNFIIDEAGKYENHELVLLPIGKLTNIALALEKEPEISDNVKVVWLGSNYPKPGEYNLANDTSALNYILKTSVPFEIVTVNYGRENGTSAIHVSLEEIERRMPGKGPSIEEGITGRHGNVFHTFGDYSVNLFQNFGLEGDPPGRPLYDVGAIAVVKNPNWAEKRSLSAPTYDKEGWTEHPGKSRQVYIWENFQRDSIVEDLFRSLD